MAKRKQSKTTKNTVKKTANHSLDYLVLFAGIGLGITGFLLSWPNTLWQEMWVFYLAAFYVIWGALHHARTDGLNWKVLAEYIGLAIILASTLLFALQY